jgi:hypothetical protein
MPFNKVHALAALCSSLLLACGSDDAQMTSAIQETLDAMNAKALIGGSACLPPLPDTVEPGAGGQPAPIFAESPPTSATLRTLAGHGLLRPEKAGTRGEPRFGVTQDGFKYLRYERTSQFAFAWNWALCTGAMRVSTIERHSQQLKRAGEEIRRTEIAGLQRKMDRLRP